MLDANFVAQAVVSHRDRLVALEPQIDLIMSVIREFGEPDMLRSDMRSLSALVIEYAPDLILELGRGWGTSTALFRTLGVPVISVCRSNEWFDFTAPALERAMPIGWGNGLNAILGEITEQDYATLIGGASRVLLLWDAHGYQVASTVLSEILPLRHGSDTLVVCHDMRDSRYFFDDTKYRGPIWTGDAPYADFVRMGNMHSTFEQIVSIVDFVTRNAIDLVSPSHELISDPAAMDVFKDLTSPACLWYYFDLPRRELTFPQPATSS
jgi:hypothetical protein